MSARENEPVAEREVVITRVYDAPARLLFEAFSTPEHVARWFAPRGYPLTLCEIDFREGGRLRMAMTGANGKQTPAFGGEYLEIVANRKIVYTNSFEMPGAPKMIITVTFDEQGGKTTLTLHTLFESIAMRKEYVAGGMMQGYESALDQLTEVVADIAAKYHA